MKGTCKVLDRDGLDVEFEFGEGYGHLRIQRPVGVWILQVEKRWQLRLHIGDINAVSDCGYVWFPSQKWKDAKERACRYAKRAGLWVEIHANDGIHFLDPWTGKIFARDIRRDT